MAEATQVCDEPVTFLAPFLPQAKLGAPMPTGPSPTLAAIHVGTNAVRLEMARLTPEGELEVVHEERDPIRPGEGVFKTGAVPADVADRLLSTLRRFAALCRRHGAQIRAVATSAVREAQNKDDIIRR